MQIRDRITAFRRVKASDLRPSPSNWRTHPESQRNALKGILAEVGYADAVITRECEDGGLQLIDGHLRCETTPDMFVPCLVTDLSEDEAKKLLLTLDPLAAMAEASKDQLDALLREVQTGNEDLAGMLTRLGESNGLYIEEPNTVGIAEAGKAECPQYKPPFQWFGGKSRVAPLIWAALGDVENYVEPFFGSGAVLFRRPHFQGDRTETVNDKDGFVANFWRAVRGAGEEVAKWADWPVNENDLTARHAWLVGKREDITRRLEGDPDWFDAKIAGWWVWGQCCWIGGGWCEGKGPWRIVDGELVDGLHRRPDTTAPGCGVHRRADCDNERQLPHVGDDGRGVNRKRPHLGGAYGVDGYQGVIRHHDKEESDGRGLCEFYSQSIQEYLQGLQDRLRRVRVFCGDWARAVTHSVTDNHGVTGVFLDPPYAFAADRDENCYAVDDADVSQAVGRWAREHGDDPNFRIVLTGYEGEHQMPDSWQCIAWKTAGGMSNISEDKTRGKDNQGRERIWLSPHCFDVTGHPELEEERLAGMGLEPQLDKI